MTDRDDQLRRKVEGILGDLATNQRAALSGHKGEAYRIATQLSPGAVERLLSIIDSERREAAEKALVLAYAAKGQGGPDYGCEAFCRPILNRLFPDQQ
jgi:hypothetical protein